MHPQWLEDNELEALLLDLESDWVERKRNAKEPNKVRQAICCFANDLPNHRKPGVIFVGIEDDGTSADLEINDRLLTQLAQMPKDGKIQPFPAVTVQKRRLHGMSLAVIQVMPADAPPVRFDGRIHVRVGPSGSTASRQEEILLNEKRRSRDLPFDLQPLPSASLDDLDLGLFRRTYLPSALPTDVLEENQRSETQQLQSLRFSTSTDPSFPTVLGMLTLGSDPLRFLPGAYIQFLRIEGTSIGDPIKTERELSGPLPDMLHELDQTLEINISTAVDITSSTREIRQADYPLAALQQLTRNAILHRAYDGTNAPTRLLWFSDRIELHSPGGLFGQVNQDNFGQPGVTDYRNPHLAEVLKNLGYVQKFGYGISTAQRALEKNGNPPAEFELPGNRVLVTVRAA